MPQTEMLLTVEANTLTWEGQNVAQRQIFGNQRNNVVELKNLIRRIKANDAKPPAKKPRHPKVKIFDDTVTFGATDNLGDMVNNIEARLDALLALV